MPEIIPNLVSTIIPVYNRATLLPHAVRSVLNQTYRPIEIIIVDDGSTDDTPGVAQKLANEFPEEIRFIRKTHRGAGPTRESGRLLARGEFIQYLDSDDLVLPQKFEIQVRALKRHPECGATYGPMRLTSLDGKIVADPAKWTGEGRTSLFPALLVDRWWSTNTPLLRRTLCDAVGPWSDLPYSQDWEYDARIGSLGTRLAFCPETLAVVRVHSANRQTGHGRWLQPPDRVEFLSRLYRYACQAGVKRQTPEMRHFSRWAFLNARECGALGDAESARRCWEIAVDAAGKISIDMKAYRVCARLIGWRLTGKLANPMIRILGVKPGTNTMKLSWMEK
ncbi:MAG: glycosyltransferase family 2 protein [Acidobacteriia bacterium]|nr:glycosyltransferase family 2 protein [Terriglobia bacterium]